MYRPEPIEIARPAPSRLEWRQGEASPVWLACLVLMILLAILVFCFSHASHVGKTMIRCDRSSPSFTQALPETIRCTRTRTEYWGLIEAEPLTVDNIVGASLHEEQQGSVTAYWAMLQVNDGTSIALTIPPPPLGKSRGRESIPVAKEIQAFLTSDASTMESEFSRLDWGVGLILAFHTVFWLWLLIRSIDYCKPVHFSIEIQGSTIQLHRTSVLWRKKATHVLPTVYRLYVMEKIYRSRGRYQSKSQIFFRPILLIASDRPFILAEGLYRSNAETLAALVQSFLQEHLEPQRRPDHTEKPRLSNDYVALTSLLSWHRNSLG